MDMVELSLDMSALKSKRALPEPVGKPYKVYRERWHMLAIVCISGAWTSVLCNVLTAIVVEAESFYQQGSTAINSISIAWSLFSLPGTAIAFLVMQRHGLRATLLIGNAVTALGALLRYLSTLMVTQTDARHAYLVLFVGSAVTAVAQNLVLGIAAQFAGAWFAAGQRDVAISICSVLMVVGNIAGVSLPPLLVYRDGSGAVHGMEPCMLGQVFISVAVLAWSVCYKALPPTPPSRSAEERLKEVKSSASLWATAQSCLGMLQALYCDRSFVLLSFAFGLGLGVFNGLFTVLGSVLVPCGYSAEQVGLCGAVMLGLGLIGSLATGFFLERSRAYQQMLWFGYLLAPLITVLIAAGLSPGKDLMLFAGFGLLGLVVLPMLPVSIQAAAETTFPIPEMYSAGALSLLSQYVGVAYSYIFDAYAPSSATDCSRTLQPTKPVLVLSIAAAGFSMLFYKASYRRMQAESFARAEAETHEMAIIAATSGAASPAAAVIAAVTATVDGSSSGGRRDSHPLERRRSQSGSSRRGVNYDPVPTGA